MKSIKYIILFAVCTALIAGCQEKPVNAGEDGENILRIKAITHGIDVKSVVDLGTDLIYAYPFSLSSEFSSLEGKCLFPYLTDGTEYSYKVPQDSQDIIFTSLTDGEYSVTTATGTETFSVSLADNTPGCEGDFVLGTLLASEVTVGRTLSYPVSLERKVAQVSINLRSKKKGSDELVEDLSKFFSKIEVYIPTYETYSIGTFPSDAGLDETYSGEINAKFSSATIPADDTVSIVSERFIFPSCGADPAQIRLVATTLSGNELDITRSMTQPISPNKSYELTLTLRQQSSDFEFSLEDIEVVNWDEVEIGSDDMVTLCVSPVLTASMTTRSGENFAEDFVLGEDDLYLYLFDDYPDTLRTGFPIKQSKISGNSYMYQIPKGNSIALFSNVDFTKDAGDEESDYMHMKNENGYYRPICYYQDWEDDSWTFDYFYISVAEHAQAASKPFIYGVVYIEDNTSSSDWWGEEITEEGTFLVSTDVALNRASTGFRVLVNFEDCSTDSNKDITTLCKKIGLRYYIANRRLLDFNHYSENSHYYINDIGTSYDGALSDPETIKEVIYKGNTYYEFVDPFYLFWENGEIRFYVEFITSDEQIKSYSSTINTSSVSKNGNNTFLITIPSFEK